MAETGRIRVLLADDHPVVRQGVREFLEQEEGIEVVGEAGDGIRALDLILQIQPDVAILDVQMPGMTGVEVTRQLRERRAQVKVLVLTAYDDAPYVAALLQGGADAYMLKTSDSSDLVRAIRAVHRGEFVLDPGVTGHVIRQLTDRDCHAAEAPLESLTTRELQILTLAARGLTNGEIGRALHISSRTVQGHLANVYGKLCVSSRTEAATLALKQGLIALD